jgi:hypothetical protein
VGTGTGYGLEGWGSFPGSGKIYAATPQHLNLLRAHPTSYVTGIVLSLLGPKRLGCEADHSTPSSEGKELLGYTATLPRNLMVRYIIFYPQAELYLFLEVLLRLCCTELESRIR